ncbi:MAG: hypothetical protein C0391_08810 [Anaerolinea sp.]|nr:hypothetical protein [Anaerolinea sp.]
MTNSKGNRDLIRAINRSIILNMIKNYGAIARAEIAKKSKLSPATVTGITANLIQEGLVFEKTSGDSTGGRPPILLALNPRGGYVVGLKLTDKEVIAALTDLEANIISKDKVTLSGNTPEVVIGDIVGLIKHLLKTKSVDRDLVFGIGLGLAGIIDPQNGVLVKSPYFGWKNIPIQLLIQEKVNLPTYIENDVNTLTLSEKLFGGGHDTENFLVVTVGRGVGLGIVMNGQFYSGDSGGAGELGHTMIMKDGPLCECGKRGCLEAFIGDPALLKEADEAFRKGLLEYKIQDITQLTTMAQTGNEVAQTIYSTAGEILGWSVANLIQVFNPGRILISGEGTRAGKFLFDPMKEAIKKYTMPELLPYTEILIDEWGDDAWARGAASLVLQEVFKSPR